MEKFLKLNLQHFAESENGEGGESGESDETKTDQKTSAEDEKSTEKGQDHMIPKSRFDEVNENYKAMKTELDNMKAEQKKAEDARVKKEQEEAESRGEYEDLYTSTKAELDSVKSEKEQASERVESLEAVINGLLETKMESIDEEFHDLIPEGMTPEQKLEWVNNAEAKGIFGNRQSSEPLGKQTNGKDETFVDEGQMSTMELMMAGYGDK